MSARPLAAGVAGALCLAASLAAIPIASAADLYGSEPRYGEATPYDDPRYADMYRHPAPPPRYVEKYVEKYEVQPPAPPRHAERHERYEGGPPGWAAPRDRNGYLAPMRPDRSYAERADCLPKREIAARLEGRGWTGIEVIERGGPVARLRASRPNGAEFEISLDTCTGEIVDRQRLSPPSYAYAPPPRAPWRGY